MHHRSNCLCFLIFFSEILANFFNISEGQFKEFQKVTQILGLCIGISFPGNVFNATIRAQEYFIASNVIGILTILLRTLLIVYFLSLNLGLIGISYSYFVSSIFGFSLNIVMCILLTENFRPSFDKIRWESAKLLLGYGLTTAAIVLGDLLRFRISNIIIGKMISLSAVGIFSIASLIAMNMVSFIAAAINVLSPRFAALYGLGDKNNFNQLFMRSLSIIAYLGIGLGTLIGILGKDFIILWVGAGFLEAVPVLWILVIALTSDTCQVFGQPCIICLKKTSFFSRSQYC